MSAPLTPPECSLTDFPFMPLDCHRLLTSKSWIEAAAVPFLSHALISLWTASWHERPAASLPDNPAILARLSMLEPKAWDKVRDRALSGWIRCTDGRLYHPVVAEKALAAWLEKLAQRLSSGAGNAKRWGVLFDPQPINDAMVLAAGMLLALDPDSQAVPRALRKRSRRDDAGTPSGTPSGSHRDRKREGEGEREGKKEDLSHDEASSTSEVVGASPSLRAVPGGRS